MLRINYYLAGAMSLVALFFYILSLSYTEDAAAWPQLFSILLILLCVLLIIDSHIKPNREKKSTKSEEEIGNTKYVIYAIVGSILYLILLNFIGFLLLTPVFLYVLFKMIGYKSMKFSITLAIGVTIVVIIIFQYMLKIPIPQGFLEGIFI